MTSATREGKERSKAETDAALKDYLDQARLVRAELRMLENTSESSLWQHAVLAKSEVERLENQFGDIRPREQIYIDIAEGLKWGPKTIKKQLITVEWLWRAGIEEVAADPHSGFTQIADVVHCSLNNDVKQELIHHVYTHDKKEPDEAYTVQAVREMIALRKPRQEIEEWERGTDFWGFNDFDERFGHDGYPGRIPGQAVLNLIKRWLPPGGNFLNAMCGSGTALDAVAWMKMTKEYQGFDIAVSARAVEKHNTPTRERITQFDATRPDWRLAVPKGWTADLLLITPPDFSFNVHVLSTEPTELGNFIDPNEWVAAFEGIVRGALSVLAPNGVLAITTKSTAEFDNGTPVPDLEFEILRILHEAGFEMFLGRSVIRVKKASPRVDGNDGKPFLIPEIRHMHVYRYTR